MVKPGCCSFKLCEPLACAEIFSNASNGILWLLWIVTYPVNKVIRLLPQLRPGVLLRPLVGMLTPDRVCSQDFLNDLRNPFLHLVVEERQSGTKFHGCREQDSDVLSSDSDL